MDDLDPTIAKPIHNYIHEGIHNVQISKRHFLFCQHKIPSFVEPLKMPTPRTLENNIENKLHSLP